MVLVSAVVVDAHQFSQNVIRDFFENRCGRISELLRGNLVWSKWVFRFLEKIEMAVMRQGEIMCFLEVVLSCCPLFDEHETSPSPL